MHQGLDLIALPAGEEHYPVEAAWSSVWPVRPDWGTGEPPRGPGTVVAGNLTEELREPLLGGNDIGFGRLKVEIAGRQGMEIAGSSHPGS